MDTGSLVQPGRQFTLSEIAEELGGVLEVPPDPVMTAGYADIYHGFWTTPQGERIEVAVKELKPLIPKDRQTDPAQLARKADTRLKREVFVWSRTEHPNLHPLLGYRLQPRSRLVSPWCRYGNLKDYLRANPGLSRGDKLRLLFQTACGLEHLHAQTPPICHADVKPENVLMNDFQGPTLSDFGLSRVLQDLDEPSGFSTSETVKGTLRYKAAELFAGQKPSLESDVYAFGGLILTVMSGKAPFYGLVDPVIIRRVMQDQPPRPVHHQNLPAEDPIWALLRRCWANRPPARPTMREVLLELLGHTLNEESDPSSRLSLPSGAEDCAEAFSNTDIDLLIQVPDTPKQSSIHWVTSNPDVAEWTSFGIPQTADTQIPIPDDISTVVREKLKPLQLRSNVVPVIGKYISAVVEVGLNLVELIQHMDSSRNASKCLELSILKLVTLIQSVEEKWRQHEGDEVPNLVGDIQCPYAYKRLRELQCVRGKLEELRSTELFGDAFMTHDRTDSMKYERTTSMVLEEVELLIDLNTTYLLTELENTDAQDQKRQLLDFLGDGDYGARGNAIEDVLCFPGTRMAILDRIDSWIRNAPTFGRVLWICGMAGRGKSTIASTVAHNWEYRASCALFHFRRGQAAHNARIVCALSRQLGSSLVPELRNAVLESIRQNRDIARQRLDVQFKILLGAPLATFRHRQHTVVIIVDALDECHSLKDAIDLVRLVDQYSSSFPPNVRFLLTCRPEAGLLRTLEPRSWQVESLDSSPEVVNDLEWFCKQILRQIREDHGLSEHWPSSSDVSRLVEMSQGLFQWARTAITYIGSRSPVSRLHDLLKRPSTWSGLDDLYHQILSKAMDNIGPDPSRRELLCQILGILVVVPHPVSLEVITVLCWNVSSSIFAGMAQDTLTQRLRQDILADLHSLLLIPSSSSEPLYLMHTSIRDLLVSEQRCKSQAYYINVAQHHERLAGMSLDLMLQSLKENICEFSDLSKANSEAQEIVDREVSAVLRYCCQAWSIHLTEGAQWSRLGTGGASSLRSNFEIFSQKKVLCWLEVMSVVGATTEAVVTATRIHQWLLECSTEPFESNLLGHLWRDMERFIVAFSEPISFGSAHIYVSALPHCPRNTRLWKWYGKQAKVQTVRGVQPSTWPCHLWTRCAGAPLVSVAFSPDSATLASGSEDGTIQLWDAQTGTPLAELPTRYNDSVDYLAFSFDGKVLASGSRDCTIQLWDAQVGTPLDDLFVKHDGINLSVAFSPDGKVLGLGSKTGTLQSWDAQTGAPLGGPFKSHDGWVYNAALSPDGKVLASVYDDATIRLWDTQTGTPLNKPLTGHHRPVISFALSPDGKVLTFVSTDGVIRLWDAQTGRCLNDLFTEYDRSILSVAFSPDGTALAFGFEEGTIQLLDARSGTPLGELLTGHDGWVDCLAFSPDSKALASGSYDGTIRLWDTQKGTPLSRPLKGHNDVVHCVAFTPDGKLLASGSYDGTVRLWDVQTGTGAPLGESLSGHDGWVDCVAFSPDGNVLASGSHDATIRLWDVHAGTPLGEPLTGHDHWIASVAFSPNGEVLASGSGDHAIRLWDAQTGMPLGEPLKGHDRTVNSVIFSPGGTALASGSYDGTVKLWNARTWALLSVPVTGYHHRENHITFSPDSKVLASGSWECTIQLWDVQNGTPLGDPLRDDHASIGPLAFSPDGKVLASASGGWISMWDAKTRMLLGKPLTGHHRSVNALAFSPDGKTLASVSEDHTIRLWDARHPGEASTSYVGGVECLAFSPDSNVFASAFFNGTILLWDAQTGTPLDEPFTCHNEWIYCVTYSPDGKVLASGSGDCTIRLWDAQTGSPLGEPLTGHDDAVHCVAFSPNSRVLASGSHDYTIRLWDVQTGMSLAATLKLHNNWVHTIVFSPDSKVIASGCGDHTVRLWDAQTGKPLGKPLTGHDNSVLCVAFSPGGKVLTSGSRDRAIRLWDAQTGAPIGKPLTGHHSWVPSIACSLEGKTLKSNSADSTIRAWNGNTRLCLAMPESGANLDSVDCPFQAVFAPQTPPTTFLEFRDHWLMSGSSRFLWLPPQYWGDDDPHIVLSNQSLVIRSRGTLSIFNISGLL